MASASPASHSTPAGTSTAAPTLSPASLDAIPVLTSILSRLTVLATGSTESAIAPGTSSAGSGDAPLNLKDIPAATDNLRHMLQKARIQTGQLPDIDREISEQEEEIKELLARIQAQRAVLESLKEEGIRFTREKTNRMEA